MKMALVSVISRGEVQEEFGGDLLTDAIARC